ncbi:MAG TPA: phasin family protein [Allosphingosinicella sp.]|nr:phasin family protein [Allosphingosinicella sp.]
MADQTQTETVAPKADVVAAPAAEAVKAATKVAKAAAPQRKTRADKGMRRPRAAKPAQRKPAARKAAAARAEGTATRIQNEGNRIMKKEANQAADRLQAMFGDVNERARTQIERSSRLTEELTELSKGHVEAMVQSTKIAAKGLEKVGQEVAEFNRKSFEDASAALKSFVELKSPTDFFRLQSDFARTQFDSFVAETSKLSETMIKLAGDVAEPLASRYSVAAERVKAAVAV